MSSMHHMASTTLGTLQLAEELRKLHLAIPAKGLPVQLRDDFYEQCIALEEHVGGEGFRKTYKRSRMFNMLSGVVALPVLLAVIVLIILRYTVSGFDPAAWVMDNLWVVALSAALIIDVLVMSFMQKATLRLLMNVEYPALLGRAEL
ncbi:hypothetical protein AUR04nite_16920 [Glutamicibacter uratoxydans]|uniref:Uncharacterized protein n=1 Tax=Glutamicibacter uratoxydans TaxID=43667 RepID=A0A4Y4DRK1_GLUUR|nr:DUF6097 family protein [Glutamicibacter uratoxydans]GED06160.1 hypothetical protein AUR04nite_16920 [Glutamicibacter uratoxydans]